MVSHKVRRRAGAVGGAIVRLASGGAFLVPSESGDPGWSWLVTDADAAAIRADASLSALLELEDLSGAVAGAAPARGVAKAAK